MEKDKELKEIIEKLTEDIRTYFNIEVPVKDIDTAVTKMGGTIVEVNDYKTLFDGTIRKNGNGFIIYVLADWNEEMRRYSIARDLGFLIISMGYATNKKLWDSFKDGEYFNCNKTGQILAAKYFADCFLMPEKELKEEVKKKTKNSKVDIKELGERFGVTYNNVNRRGIELGVIEGREY